MEGRYSKLGVYRFKIWYWEEDLENRDFQYRDVIAEDEQEAERKLQKHNDLMVKQGYMRFHIGSWECIATNVIV